MTITNRHNIPLELAVWVLYDDYEYIQEDNCISVTGLMKPLRHILLPPRIPVGDRQALDVEDLVASALGKAIHAAIELAWKFGNHSKALRKLGLPEETVKRVLVNPTPEQVQDTKDVVPVYVEQRTTKTLIVDGVEFKITGKFDMVPDGRVTDTKSTTVFSWIMGNKDDEYRLQMSIYRWLNPDKVTEDHGRINFVFTDWSKLEAKRRSDYPPKRLMSKEISLLSIEDTERWITDKIRLILRHRDTHEQELPECTDEELWVSAPTFKYYSNPVSAENGGRSTRNFSTLSEAETFMDEKGKGVVKTVKGNPRRCAYCSAFPVCTQKDKYDHD